MSLLFDAIVSAIGKGGVELRLRVDPDSGALMADLCVDGRKPIGVYLDRYDWRSDADAEANVSDLIRGLPE
jgi:hypothetical protein